LGQKIETKPPGLGFGRATKKGNWGRWQELVVCGKLGGGNPGDVYLIVPWEGRGLGQNSQNQSFWLGFGIQWACGVGCNGHMRGHRDPSNDNLQG
jgi:hypothetical protein